MSALTGVILYLRSIYLKPRLKTRFQNRLWYIFNACSWLSCLGMLGVGAISVYTEIVTHLVFSFMLFVSGIVIMFVSTILDNLLRLPLTKSLRLVRYSLTAIAIISGVILGVFFIPYPFVGSMAELVATACMTLYIASFAHKLEDVESKFADELDHIRANSDRRLSDLSTNRRRVV
jgi:hypothetical protein